MYQATSRFGLIALAALMLILISGCAANQSGDSDLDSLSTEEAAERGRQAWKAKEYDRALVLLEKASRAGNARAQYALGYMYYAGQGAERDLDKSLKWIRRAADQGDKRAIEALGRIADGLSVQPGRSDGEDTDSKESRDEDATTRPAEPNREPAESAE